MKWFLPISAGRCFSGLDFLQLALRVSPLMLPRRFGEFEPPKYQMPQDQQQFCDMWPDRAEDFPRGGYFYWTTERPCFMGSLSHATRLPGENGVECLRLTASWDLRKRESDELAMDDLVEVFSHIAANARAFYAVGYVLRGVVAGRRPTYDALSEDQPLPKSATWVGPPAQATWLTWLGRPYRDLMRDSAPQWARDERDQGLLIRLGRFPQDRDQLAPLNVRWPEHLVARPPVQVLSGPIQFKHKGKTVQIPAVLGPSQAADHIPDLTA